MDNQGRVTQAEYHAALDRRERRITALSEENARLRKALEEIKARTYSNNRTCALKAESVAEICDIATSAFQ